MYVEKKVSIIGLMLPFVLFGLTLGVRGEEGANKLWFRMSPPGTISQDSQYIEQLDAPLRQWKIIDAYVSSDKCQQAVESMAAALAAIPMHNVCIGSSDPRLGYKIQWLLIPTASDQVLISKNLLTKSDLLTDADFAGANNYLVGVKVEGAFESKDYCDNAAKRKAASSSGEYATCASIDDSRWQAAKKPAQVWVWRLIEPPELGGEAAPVKEWKTKEEFDSSAECKEEQEKLPGTQCIRSAGE